MVMATYLDDKSDEGILWVIVCWIDILKDTALRRHRIARRVFTPGGFLDELSHCPHNVSGRGHDWELVGGKNGVPGSPGDGYEKVEEKKLTRVNKDSAGSCSYGAYQ